MPILSTTDVAGFTPGMSDEERQALIDGALAIAGVYAPCLRQETLAPHVEAAAKAIIVKAIKYDLQAEEAGPTRNTEQIGPYGVTNFTPRSSTFYSPQQIELLRSLCGMSVSGVYSLQLGMPDTLAEG